MIPSVQHPDTSSVLFTDGDWRISRTSFDKSAIYHQCGDEFNVDTQWWHISTEDRCVFCGVAVPAEIQGLLILHNWDL